MMNNRLIAIETAIAFAAEYGKTARLLNPQRTRANQQAAQEQSRYAMAADRLEAVGRHLHAHTGDDDRAAMAILEAAAVGAATLPGIAAVRVVLGLHPVYSLNGNGELRTDQLTRGMTVRLKHMSDRPTYYNNWFTVVEVIAGPDGTAAPLKHPAVSGDTEVFVPADALWQVRAGLCDVVPPSTTGSHGPLVPAPRAPGPRQGTTTVPAATAATAPAPATATAASV